jgi:3-deoxy-D-manno-octulosonic-acid transferase
LSRPPLRYRLASLGLALPLLGYTLVRTARDGGAVYLRSRYGFTAPCSSNPVWIHCASVGEVAAAAPLLRALDAHGIGPLLISTATPTGQQRARALGLDGAVVTYLPMDRPGPVRRFLARTNPRAALILETELWPWLFGALEDRSIPIVLVNGRLSPRTLDAPAWWRQTAQWCLQRVCRVLARSDADGERFLELGLTSDRLEVTGNLKFATPGGAPVAAIDPGSPFVLAASTHDDEERQLARAWAAAGPRDHLLVIAPRHPERGAGIASALAREGFEVRRRSQGEAAGPPGSIYLADTLGELTGLIAAAEVVVMGGSLIRRGGQNVLEPARAGRPIVTGPHMDNFANETERLESAGALVRKANASQVIAAVAGLLAAPDEARRMGAAGRELMEQEADMDERYVRALVRAVPALSGTESDAPKSSRDAP